MLNHFVSANYISPVLNYDAADALCQEIIRQVDDDNMDELKARHKIAVLLEQTRLAWRTAHEFNKSYAMQIRVDMGAEMSTLLYNKIMQTDGRGLEFDKAKGSSVAGWARTLLRTANMSLLRKVATGPIAEPNTDELNAIIHHKPDGPFQNSETDAVGYEVAMEWFSARSRQLRDNSRLQAAAQSVMFSLDVPPLIRPDHDERIRLRRLFEAAPGVAYQSACVVRSIHDRNPILTPIDAGFLALWDDFPYDEIDRVVSKNENFAYTLVAGVLADKPRPIRTTIRDFRALVRDHGVGQGWRAKADELCEAYFALEFEAYSSFDARGVAKHEMLTAGQALTRARAADTIRIAIEHPGQRLGSSQESVFAVMDDIMSTLNDRPVEPVEVSVPADDDEDAGDIEPELPLELELEVDDDF